MGTESKSKFLKAHCGRTGGWYGLEAKQFSGRWKIVNMVSLSEEEARITSSEIRQDSFETNRNLLACAGCGSRRVGGCACAKRSGQCSKGMGYRFGCIYCDELEIDYSLPTREEIAGLAVGKVTLSQGQEVSIRYADGRPLSKIYVGVGWDPAKNAESDAIDVDSSVVLVSRSGKIERDDIVFYGNKMHSSGCVVHHGDNLTGENFGNGDDENISVDLSRVPAIKTCLYFVLNIYDCADRRQTLGIIRNLYIRLCDPVSKRTLVEYKVLDNFRNDTALIIGAAYRKDGGWSFKAIGKGSRAKDIDALADECGRMRM